MTDNIKTVGEWTWNSDVLWSKVVKTGEDDCWAWIGSTGPHTNLFGAKKSGSPRMTQATRILYRDVTGEDCEHLQVKHTCHDPYCVNPKHFELKPNQRKYRMDGSDNTIPKPKVKPYVKQAKLQPLQTQQRWWQV